MTDAELGASMSSKNMRTKVYSGVKTGALLNVPTLHEMCIRILQRNIEALEATGGVPFEILKPVLERATPEQLFTLEDYNPYLIDDTDDLWKGHCNRKFRGKQPNEYESWRDMFLVSSFFSSIRPHVHNILLDNNNVSIVYSVAAKSKNYVSAI